MPRDTEPYWMRTKYRADNAEQTLRRYSVRRHDLPTLEKAQEEPQRARVSVYRSPRAQLSGAQLKARYA